MSHLWRLIELEIALLSVYLLLLLTFLAAAAGRQVGSTLCALNLAAASWVFLSVKPFWIMDFIIHIQLFIAKMWSIV